ncbi:MAG: hypothetical protein A2086_15460 [Spirochaetes bacterium GWD1_27_9]|nr:MAG: hypothetical protein A2Y34_01875 [Spirochaetes bacterium GWC1_27_15]OHD42780.1 MAG: hypothetical protein A2086_15460 [Spirochaetes bacterium GWD1_27_9]
MEKLDNIIEKVNHFLKKEYLPIISNTHTDLDSLYREALKFIWVAKSISKREDFINNLNGILMPYIGANKLFSIFEIYSLELDSQYPPEINIVELYDLCLKEYDIFTKYFIDTENISLEKLNKIVRYLIFIVKKDKNFIISHIASGSENYNYQTYHCVNSTILAIIGGITEKFDDLQLYDLGLAGLLHDIGMVKIPQEIVNKDEKLTDDEYDIIKTHPVIAYKLISAKNIVSSNVLAGVIQHHERFDGNGYPKRLKGEEIHVFAKILAVADSFEAQTSFRNYRKSKTGYMAMKEVLSSYDGKFDSNILTTFLMSFSIYPPGTIVQLNNNSIGVVLSVNPSVPLRPSIKLIIDEFGDKVNQEVIKNLKEETNLFIASVINKDEYKRK